MISFDHSPNPIHRQNPSNNKNKNKNKRSMEDLMTSESEDQTMIQYHTSSKAKTMKWAASSFDTDLHLHLQSPSPNYSDQQCHLKTHMNLDLELNLPCGTSFGSGAVGKNSPHRSSYPVEVAADDEAADQVGDQKEMVAAACRRCHMLVMMCKASPACPNCKFIHPPDLTTQPPLFMTKPRRTTWPLLC